MNYKVYIVVSSSLMLLVCLVYLGSYAFYTSDISGTGNTENNTSIVNTEDLTDLTITDGNNVVNDNMIPGDTSTTTFTVTNPNSIPICFDLLWKDVVNTFVNYNDLLISLETNDGTVLIKESDNVKFPLVEGSLIEGISVLSGESKTYTLKVHYKNTDADQTGDMGKVFSATIEGELGDCK